MKFVVKLFPEITIKTKPVRQLLTKQLMQNARNVLKRITPDIKLRNVWDAIEVWTPDSASAVINDSVYAALECIPGIAHINRVREFDLVDLDQVVEDALAVWGAELTGKTFVVRVKRAGKHDFTSVEAERYIGGGLNQKSQAKGVDLHTPERVVQIEIRNQKVFVVEKRREGLGGYPLSTAGDTLSLVSGGFDSTVASYLMMRRGVRSHFLFFNLGGAAHENGVKEVIYFLWKKYGSSHKVSFVTVPFEGVVEGILDSVEDRYMGVVLKRMMMRAANRVCQRMRLDSFVTGEALSQVSSQTMKNQRLIDEVAEPMVIRPLAVTDKQDIVSLARQIGAARFVERIPEYCGVISRKPNASCKKGDILRVEDTFDYSLLERAIEDSKVESIDKMQWQSIVDMTLNDNRSEDKDSIVIDVRHPQEIEDSPLAIEGLEVIAVPFYSLNRKFPELDHSKTYLLYCDKGVMSKMHALHLQDAGFTNVSVYNG